MNDHSPKNPTILIIFGATGDLTQRKLIPSLFNLYLEESLPEKFTIVGFARRARTDEEFRADMVTALQQHAKDVYSEQKAKRFAKHIRYCQSDFADVTGYDRLRTLLEDIEREQKVAEGGSNRLFYLSTPPDAYAGIVENLGQEGLTGTYAPAAKQGWTRLIIEKPFGHDLASAEELNAHILRFFDERQVYRIDHYLGKETVQNILTFRLGNSIFEPLWNRNYIDHVQILVAEQIGIEGRGNYYDKSGALRDIVQNHMLQVLALIAMEPPAVFNADGVRNEKVKVLQAIRPMDPSEVNQLTVRGQYASYKSEEGVAPDSKTETFVAMKMLVDNWRWSGIPFYLRTGKSLARRVTEITVQFRQPPLMLFAHQHHEGHEGPDNVMEPNLLTIRVQPDEGISLRIGLKPPGGTFALRPVTLDFDYSDTFGADAPEAYQRLLLDAMAGDPTLFIRRDEVEAAWALMDPIMEGWQIPKAPNPSPYWAGSWGPDSANTLIERDGREWYVSKEDKS